MTKASKASSASSRTAAVVSFLIETAIYAVFVFGYYFAVLHFRRDWLKDLFDDRKLLYALAALGLMVGQAVLLELVTAALAHLTRRKPR